MYNKINDELNSIIKDYIIIKVVIYTLETIEKVITILQTKKGDKNEKISSENRKA